MLCRFLWCLRSSLEIQIRYCICILLALTRLCMIVCVSIYMCMCMLGVTCINTVESRYNAMVGVHKITIALRSDRVKGLDICTKYIMISNLRLSLNARLSLYTHLTLKAKVVFVVTDRRLVNCGSI